MSTIKDVARLAGVSVATVSRLMNGGDNVREDTAKRVRAAIEQLNYSPNLLGRTLRQGETKKILVLLNTISNQFYSRVVKGIEESARKKGYTVMVCMTHGDASLEEDYLRLLKTRLVDGAIFLTVEQEGPFLNETLAGFPVVQACEPKEGFFAPSVSIDNEKAAYEAMCYLIKKGHHEIAFFGAGGIYGSSLKRKDGYLRALAEFGISVRKEWILEEGFSVNAGIRAADRLLKTIKLPTAVFCISDSVAAGAIRAFSEKGVSVPERLSVMGFDNTQISDVFIPSITTTKQPQYEIGTEAMELLFEQIEQSNTARTAVILHHEIIERDSVKERKNGSWKK